MICERYAIRFGKDMTILSKESYLSQPQDILQPLPATWNFRRLTAANFVWEMELFTDEPLPKYCIGEVWVLFSDCSIIYQNCAIEKIDDMIYKIYASDSYLSKQTIKTSA